VTIDEAIRELEALLYGGNYVVGLDRYRVPPIPGGSPGQYVAAVLGAGAGVGEVSPVTGPEVLAEVGECLSYPGDAGAGPFPEVFRSPRFKDSLDCVLAHLQESITRSTVVVRFRLWSGYRVEPVWWEFAFVMAGAWGAEVFVGASSD
jgi:hypothetical protein